jgi:hypothetical protein
VLTNKDIINPTADKAPNLLKLGCWGPGVWGALESRSVESLLYQLVKCWVNDVSLYIAL